MLVHGQAAKAGVVEDLAGEAHRRSQRVDFAEAQSMLEGGHEPGGKLLRRDGLSGGAVGDELEFLGRVLEAGAFFEDEVYSVKRGMEGVFVHFGSRWKAKGKISAKGRWTTCGSSCD